LFVKLQEQLRPASHRHGVLLSAVTAGARDGDSGDAGAEQRFFDGRKAVGADDTANEFHCSPRATGRVDRAIKQNPPRSSIETRGIGSNAVELWPLPGTLDHAAQDLCALMIISRIKV